MSPNHTYTYTNTYLNKHTCKIQALSSGGIDKSSPTQDIHSSPYCNQPHRTKKQNFVLIDRNTVSQK